MQYNSCGAGGAPLLTRFVANDAVGVPGPPPVDPAVLAQEAYRQIPIPDPLINFGPNDQQIAVNYWSYLWVDDPGAITQTATAGGVSVTATAKLSTVTWSMGEPGAAPIVCQGPGAPPPANADITVDPRPAGYCAYSFRQRSTADRTGGTRTWPVTASATWTITWQQTAGGTAAGEFDAPPFTSTTGLCVGAWSTVAVADGYTPPNRTCGSA